MDIEAKAVCIHLYHAKQGGGEMQQHADERDRRRFEKALETDAPVADVAPFIAFPPHPLSLFDAAPPIEPPPRPIGSIGAAAPLSPSTAPAVVEARVTVDHDGDQRTSVYRALDEKAIKTDAPVAEVAPYMALPLHPFSLFDAALHIESQTRPPSSIDAAPLSPSGALVASIEETMRGLLAHVMATQPGAPVQMRMDLNERYLPDVTLVVYEDGGKLMVDFISGHEASIKLLNASSPTLVREMAQSLNRPVEWRVMTDRDDDLPPLVHGALPDKKWKRRDTH